MGIRYNPWMRLPALIIFALVLFSSVSCEKPVASVDNGEYPDTGTEPYQALISDPVPFPFITASGRFIINPVAEYEISARVVSTRSYSRGWTASLSPVDLALVWGNLADERMDEFIKYSQRNRWYYYRYHSDCPVDNDYIISHSSNNHIIPANRNLSLALKSIRENDRVLVSGMLVSLTGNAGDKKVSWGTSRTRNDTGDRSCELIFAEEIRINKKIYR